MAFFRKLSSNGVISASFRVFLLHINPFYLHLGYFLIISLLGFIALKLTSPRTAIDELQNLDMFFTSVSACTVSSMSVIEMEVFSNTQLLIITLLMFMGGQVFSSFLSLHLRAVLECNTVNSLTFSQTYANSKIKPQREEELENGGEVLSFEREILKSRARKYLSFVILGFILAILAFGSCLILLYTRFVSSARNVLESKGLDLVTFSVFSTVSSFSNCGFIPTNENMIIFKENSGLLLMFLPLTLLGNTLYPPFLRFLIWVLKKMTKKEEFSFVLTNHEEMGFDSLFSDLRSGLLVATVFGFLGIQLIALCSMEWSSAAMDGLSFYQKVVAFSFQVVNSRHTGESVFDLSVISPAVLVVFVLMMYFSPYTTFIPTKYQQLESRNQNGSRKMKSGWLDSMVFSDLSYLLIFIVLISISERDKSKFDPLNFNILSITLEVISAYGNVGFTLGYSCKRQIKLESFCEDKWIGFVGIWSEKGKIILIVVMLFGRLKGHRSIGGKAWIS